MIVNKVKEFINNPEEGAKNFVDNANLAVIGIIAAVYTLMSALFNVIYKIVGNIEYKMRLAENADLYHDMDLEEYLDEFDTKPYIYDFFDFLDGILNSVVVSILGIIVLAVVMWLGVKFINKTKLSVKSALALATIELLIYIPFVFVNNVLGIIPDFEPLTWIMSMISSVRAWGCVIITFIALKGVCGSIKNAVYVGAPVYAVNSLATSIILFVLSSGMELIAKFIDTVF